MGSREGVRDQSLAPGRAPGAPLSPMASELEERWEVWGAHGLTHLGSSQPAALEMQHPPHRSPSYSPLCLCLWESLDLPPTVGRTGAPQHQSSDGFGPGSRHLTSWEVRSQALGLRAGLGVRVAIESGEFIQPEGRAGGRTGRHLLC